MTADDIQLFMLLFSDDAVVFAHEPEASQSLLNYIERFCITWNLKLNDDKTNIMIL